MTYQKNLIPVHIEEFCVLGNFKSSEKTYIGFYKYFRMIQHVGII
jgi:hypothetical protein